MQSVEVPKPKLCRDCKYRRMAAGIDVSVWGCEEPRNVRPEVDVVSGYHLLGISTCYAMRSNSAAQQGGCGPDGSWFVAASNWRDHEEPGGIVPHSGYSAIKRVTNVKVSSTRTVNLDEI